jgi:serine/threonine-protein kinase
MNAPHNDTQYAQAAAALGYVTEAQVQDCVQVQSRMREMGIEEGLGEILSKKGFLTPQHHTNILKKLGVTVSPIPGYSILGRIGQGGMGAVYKAVQTSVNRTVAIKIMSQSATKDKTFVARFLQEAQSAAQLSHKNLIAAIDVGVAGGLYYFVMEFVTGRSCREMLNTKGPFPEKEAVAIAAQMAEVLQHIHEHRMVHRDIKPENMLLTPEGVVKLCDLGLAKSTTAVEQSLTQEGLAVGTPYFMSPEQVRGDKDVDIRADLYSLGTTLYFMVTGKHPYEGKSAPETMSLHLNAPIPDARKAAPGLREDVSLVIHKLMAKDRGERYQEPKDLLEDLKRIQAGGIPQLARQHAARTHVLHKSHATQRFVARHAKAPRWPFYVAGGGVAAGAAAFLLFFSGGTKAEPQKPVEKIVIVKEKPAEKAPEAPKDDPAKLLEASRLFGLGEEAYRQEKWANARGALGRVQKDFGALHFTKERAAAIGQMLGVCDRKLQEVQEASKAEADAALQALREGRWKDAHAKLQALVHTGRSELQKDLDRCRLEMDAEGLIAEAYRARDAGAWAEAKSKIETAVARYGATQSAQKEAAGLAAALAVAEEELKTAQEAVRIRSAAQTAALTGKWDPVVPLLGRFEAHRERQAYKAFEGELRKIRSDVQAALAQQDENKAKNAWTAALQRYGDQMKDTKYDEAMESLKAFARDFAHTKHYEASRAEIDSKTKLAEAAKKREHETEAANLWKDAQDDFRKQAFEPALDALQQLAAEYADTPTTRNNLSKIKQMRSAIENSGKLPTNVLVEMDFEDFPGAWTLNNMATGGNAEEPHQGKRAARLVLPDGGRANHPLVGMNARAETISFWGRSRSKSVAPVQVVLHETANMMTYSWTQEVTFPTEWKYYSFRIADFRPWNDNAKSKRQINPAGVNLLTISTADNYDGPPLEIQFDTLRVEAKK